MDLGSLLTAHEAAASTSSAALRFADALEALVASLNADARLTPEGARAAQAQLAGSVALQGQLRHLESRHPAVARTPVGPPVFITALPGSGATALQHLLAAHPDLDAPALWETFAPAAPAPGPRERRELIGRARSAVTLLGGGAPSVTQPASCHRLLANAFQSTLFTLHLRIPGYEEWLGEQDLTDAYRFHREQLRAITWRVPGATMVLRDPFHGRHAGALSRAYPGARIIRIHRDPADTIAHAAGVGHRLRGRWSAAGDPGELGAEWRARIKRTLVSDDSYARMRAEGRTLDIRYDDLVAAPVPTVRAVLRFLGVAAPAVLDREAAGLPALAAAPGGTGAGPRPEDFGLRRAELDEEFAVYRERYGFTGG
ncbi:sulfotransferase family protein [Streptomyces sp. URMC 127]|uniref:sulfotransferase family protein n=1 Tax=Streptomyces sp. URMC 127 TaxID=3423402 RepID=UPI003F1A7754